MSESKTELNDYSGPYKHDLVFEDFSKEFLIKLMHQWRRQYLRLAGYWYEGIQKRVGLETADEIQLEVWKRIGERQLLKYLPISNIKLNTCLDSLKLMQLVPDSWMGTDLFDGHVEIINDNHLILTCTHCVVLEFFERTNQLERIPAHCQVMEIEATETYLCNPKIKVTGLKLPPRDGPDDICCQFEYLMMEEDQR
jgi:hypothetical protein